MPENAPNITIYVSPVSTELALALAAAESIAKPARVVYVFGTADNVAPNLDTVAGAITYANSLLPNEDNPVVVRLFVNANNEPYTLAGLSSWTTYANQYIYFVSDFVRLNETTTLPTTLPVGLQVWYRDGNDVEYLYIGNVDGDAQLVAPQSKSDIGLGNVDNTSDANKPISTDQNTAIVQAGRVRVWAAQMSQSGANAPTYTSIASSITGLSTVAWTRTDIGNFTVVLPMPANIDYSSQTVQVSQAFSTGSEPLRFFMAACQLPGGANIRINVRSFDTSGAPADPGRFNITLFVVKTTVN